jgi:hypothetical protein
MPVGFKQAVKLHPIVRSKIVFFWGLNHRRHLPSICPLRTNFQDEPEIAFAGGESSHHEVD